jgi:outer membrane protein assembly factor BamA
VKINPKICLVSIASVFLDFQVALVDASELDVPCVEDPCAKALETTQKNITPIKINIKIHPIFDESKPEENNYLFRLANRLHIDTHESVVAKDLLVENGDYLDNDLLAESERILRTRHYFNNASITTHDEDNGQVDVDVFEVWTLVPSLSYSHAGGKSTSGFGLHDSNFLGYGKTINILHTSSAERSGELFNYRDPNTGWHQTALNLSYADNSDGKHQYYEWVRPYFALSTVNAGGITYEQFDQEDSLYNAGEIVQTFGHSSEKQEFFYGAKMSLSDKHNIHRWNIGYTQEEDIFFPLDNDLSNNPLPHNRDFNTSWIEYAYIHDGYIEASNIQQINRIEDINLGLQSRVRLGFANSSYKEYDNSYQFSHNISQGFVVSEASLLLAELRYEGLYNEGKIYNGILEGSINYHWQNFESGQLYLSLEGARGLRLFGDKALSLGGDNGLRGYPAYYQTGDKRYLLTMEQRFYGEKEWFSLFHMGYAIFYDQGRAWGDSLVPQSETGTLRDFGMGLRISGTRNGSRDEGGHNVLHIDIATPLDAGPDTSKLQWLVKVKHSF